MKKSLLTLALVASVAGGAFAQGRLTAGNNTATAITLMSPTTNGIYVMEPRPQDSALGGQPVPTTGALPSGVFLDYGLYAGTSAASLALVTTISINTSNGTSEPAGLIVGTLLNLPTGFPGGHPYDFEVKVWDSQYASFEAEQAAVGLYGVANTDYLGETSVFTFTPSSSAIAAPPITGPAGNYPTGPLYVFTTSVIPEPATFALAGLGAAAVLIFRRRK